MAGPAVPERLFSVHAPDAAVRVRLQSLSASRQGTQVVRGLSCPDPVSVLWRASMVGHSCEGHSDCMKRGLVAAMLREAGPKTDQGAVSETSGRRGQRGQEAR